MVYTKKDFVNYVAEANDITKKDANFYVNCVLDAIHALVVDGNEINMTGFGQFYHVDVPEASKTNPATREKIVVPAHQLPKFKWATNIKKEMRE